MKLEQLFWDRVNKTDNCWLWSGTLNMRRNGYGYLKHKGKMYRAHRLSYALHNGEFNPELDVCHKCDRPACVNPSHLFLGTAKDNCQDAVRKGRTRRGQEHGLNVHPERKPWGERNGQSKLKVEQVREIKDLYSKRLMSAEDLGKRFGVSSFNIYKIMSGKLWPNV